MTLTKIKTDGITNDAVTKEKIPANQIEASELANDAVDTNAIQDDAVTTVKILDENITLAKLEHGTPSNDGKFLRANNGADPTFETVSIPAAFNDDKIVNDISTLALQINALQNASKFATASVYVDNFNDAAGIASFSSMARNDNKYVGIQHNYGSVQYWETTDLDENRIINYNLTGFYASRFVDGSFGAYAGYISNPSSYSAGFGYEIGADSDFGVGFIMTGAQFYNFSTNARFRYFKMETADSGGSSGTFVNQFNSSGTGNYDTSYDNDVSVQATNTQGWVGMTLTTPYVVPSNTAAWRFTFHNKWNNGNNSAGAAELKIQGQKITSENATGHFISNAVTAPSSTSSMGAVILYKDHFGTATLNTDLKVYLSADNGSNFTQGTLVALPDFATGVKMAKINDLSVTAGTQLKYKVEVLNQANASKETRIDGVSLQY